MEYLNLGHYITKEQHYKISNACVKNGIDPDGLILTSADDHGYRRDLEFRMYKRGKIELSHKGRSKIYHVRDGSGHICEIIQDINCGYFG